MPIEAFRARLDASTPALRERLLPLGGAAFGVLDAVMAAAPDVWPEFRPTVASWCAEQTVWLEAQPL